MENNDRKFADLLNQHLKSVYNFVYRMTGNVDDAEDITQETFFKAWKNFNSYDPNKSFKTWVFTIAKNTTTDLFRKKKATPLSYFEDDEGDNPLADKLTDPSPMPEETLAQIEKRGVLDNLIASLPSHYREVIILRYINDFSLGEIAEALNRPPNTVRSQHKRALAMLKTIINNATKSNYKS